MPHRPTVQATAGPAGFMFNPINPVEPDSARLPLREKIGYGLGDTASNIFFQTVNLFLLFYYTDAIGLSPAVAGTLFVVARFWDALADPFVGAVADRTRSRWGSYRPYLLWMAIPFGVIGYATFANPDVGATGKLVYACLTYLLLMTVYAAINVPYSALMGVMTPSSRERTSLSSYRFAGAVFGQLLIAIGVLPLVRVLGGGDQALGFKLTMAIFSAVAVVLFLATFALTRERVVPQAHRDPSIRQDLLALARNRPWIIMVVAALFTLSSAAVRWAVTPHFFKYHAGDDGTPVLWFLDRTSLFTATGALAFLAGICFTPWLVRRFGKRNPLIALTLLNAIPMLAFYFIPRDAYGTMLAVNAIGSVIAGPTPALVWSIYTDVADYGEWSSGRRITGLAFAAAMFAQKLGMSIGGGLAGWWLGACGFEAGKVQTEETLHGLLILFSLLPGALAVANGLVLLGYPLSDAMVRRIEEELAERRASTPA